MDELAAAERDTDMRRSLAHSLEEHEVARLYFVVVNLLARLVLLSGFTRERRSVLGEHPLDQPAAVEPLRRLAAAISILRAPYCQRRGDDFRCDCRALGALTGGRFAA